MSKKRKKTRWSPHIEVEIVNWSTKKRKIIKLSDEKVFFDEKTGMYKVISISSSSYGENDNEKEA
jgi:hypothetical protein|tara:strand:- start:93 stop:287 length:195 start_codon:yes stop_codon:yes gene_type:complete